MENKIDNNQSADNDYFGNQNTQQKTEKDKTDDFFIKPPTINLPKGGGSIQSIDEKFTVNAINGTAGLSIPLPFSEARGFTPSLSISYNSGNGNGLFGMGWSLDLNSIKRKTDKQLPQYKDAEESDVFMLTGSEDLVPEYKTNEAGDFITDAEGNFILNEYDSPDNNLKIKRYRPRIEGAFARIERWYEKNTGVIHWRIISSNNITTVYGKSASSRIHDPSDPTRIYEWFMEYSFDDKGNICRYDYKQEDLAGIDHTLLHNKNRVNANAPVANTYLKKIRYGNVQPYKNFNDPLPDNFLFETVLDYGEHDPVNIPFNPVHPWKYRTDAFSSYKSGFEIRTARLCKRVLLYHHFNELPSGNALIKSMQFNYDNNGEDRFTFLREVISTGYTKHDDGTYTSKQIPPLTFNYQVHEWNKEVKSIEPEQLIHAPAGLDTPDYILTDFYSEGLSGILTEQGDGLYYKSNLGQGRFGPAQLVAQLPSFKGINKKVELMELEGNGIKQLVHIEQEPKGFFELQPDEEWQSFVAFEEYPNEKLQDANARLIDLNGDGRAEVLITEDHVFTWYPSKGKSGFDMPQKVARELDEEKGPVLVFKDEVQTIFLADMSGDGLTDLVRIKNGEVCYWPNMGYAKFGAKVSMDNAPWFDHADIYDPNRIMLADIDGSGTSDIVYIGEHQITIYLNQQGNAFHSSSKHIEVIPDMSNGSKVTVADLLGNGMACIVWNSSQPKHQSAPLRYIDLMNSKKPHLLTSYKNNMGSEVHMEFKPSTEYYIEDKLNGTPWITKLPFPVYCVSKVISHDRIMKTRFASEYSYHHGYFDYEEREFRGFGRVDQRDCEDIVHFIKESTGAVNNIIEQDLHQSPVLIKSWYHTGAVLDAKKIINQYEQEYFKNTFVPENLLSEPELPTGMTTEEWKQAIRTCKGMLLRKEVYAEDGKPESVLPYSVQQQNCLIKKLQPIGNNKHAVFLSLKSEAIDYHYERIPFDPRVQHSFILEADNYGNIIKQAALVYPRRPVADGEPPHEPEQTTLHLTYSETTFTNAIDNENEYRTPLTYTSKSFEITGVSTPTGYFSIDSIRTICTTSPEIDYDVIPSGGIQKRLLAYSKVQYRSNDTVTPLAFGIAASKGLVHQTLKAAFNQHQLTTIFSSKISLPDLHSRLTDLQKGGYDFAENYYWIGSGTQNYDPDHFYLSTEIKDSFGNTTSVTFDTNYFLFVKSVTDPSGNEVQVNAFNYRILSPYITQDSNDNQSAVRFDELGQVVKIFTLGKLGIDAGDVFDFSKVEMKDANDHPGSELSYELFEWQNQTQDPSFNPEDYKPRPNFSTSRAFTTHFLQDPGHIAISMQSYTYFNGSGKVVLKKVQAEPGMALLINPDGSVSEVNTDPSLRWVGNGRTILNNKGNTVKQYEPYFSVNHHFDDEKEMVQLGVSPVNHYDPLGRIVKTILPDKTFTRSEITPWKQISWDNNDTSVDSEWYDSLGSPDPLGSEPVDPQERTAWLAAQHYNTPSIAHFDTLGRTFLTVVNTSADVISARIRMDVLGRQLELTDGLNRKVVESVYDMTGKTIRQMGMEDGTRWFITDVLGSPLSRWDEKDQEFSFQYDASRRPVRVLVKIGAAAPLVYSKTEYGDSLPDVSSKPKNLKGKVYRLYDQASLLTNISYDFKGNLLNSSKQFVTDYKGLIHWENPSAIPLETEIFNNASEYDALNRPTKIVTPHNASIPASEYFPIYNESGLLEAMEVKVRGASERTTFVSNINYNAKEQRVEIFYGNGTTTKFTYDENTFRLKRLLTTRNAGADILQDLHYFYDPVGNITFMKDDAQPEIFFDGEIVKPESRYHYDALYRLIKATGRKHAGQTDIDHSRSDFNYRNHPFQSSSVISPNDSNAFRNYREDYFYDKAGNMQELQHISKNSNWTRTFEYSNGNNQLTRTTLGSFSTNYTYDVHGNIELMEHLNQLIWDFQDKLKEVDLGGGGKAYYVYDASGQRVRKVIERLDGKKLERLYLGTLEIYRERDAGGSITLERETLHISDDAHRIAMVETPTIKSTGNHEVPITRYQYSNAVASACMELDHAGALISYEEYFPFGTTSYTITDNTREVAAKRYRYTGKERDEESGFNYHGARYYAPWICRWISADPIGVSAGLNLYCYVKNNPVMFNDPLGTQEMCGVYDENEMVCRPEPCPEQSLPESPPPPTPLPPRVRHVPRRPPTPPPTPEPAASGGQVIAPPPPVSGPDYTLYVPQGFAYTQYQAAEREFANPDNPLWARGAFFVLGVAAGPFALAEEYIARPIVNIPYTVHNAGIGIGEHLGRAYLWSEQGEYGEATVEVLHSVVNFSSGFNSAATVAVPVAGALESRVAAATTATVESRVVSTTTAETTATTTSATTTVATTEVSTTTARVQQLVNVAESGQVTWVAGDARLFTAYADAMAASRTTATGRQAFDLLRGRMASRTTLGGPIHHWRFPISTYAGEATAAQNLYLTQGSAHLQLHRAIGITGSPYRAMAWGAESEIQMMFNFWNPNSSVPLNRVLTLLP